MPEKVRVAMHPELVVGGLLVTAGLIGLGVAQLFRRGDRT